MNNIHLVVKKLLTCGIQSSGRYLNGLDLCGSSQEFDNESSRPLSLSTFSLTIVSCGGGHVPSDLCSTRKHSNGSHKYCISRNLLKIVPCLLTSQMDGW